MAACRQSPYVHKPAVVKLLLLIYTSNSGLRSVQWPRLASHAHFRHRHISVTDTCGFNTSIDNLESATNKNPIYNNIQYNNIFPTKRPRIKQ